MYAKDSYLTWPVKNQRTSLNQTDVVLWINLYSVLLQHEKILCTKTTLVSFFFSHYLGDVEDTTATCTSGRPGSFVNSGLPWRRDALWGFESITCCMSFESTLKTAWRSPLSFWQVAMESTPPIPDCCAW